MKSGPAIGTTTDEAQLNVLFEVINIICYGKAS
jgi:hypothetical protein